MLTGFYSNMGMGAKNLIAIHPPSLISDEEPSLRSSGFSDQPIERVAIHQNSIKAKKHPDIEALDTLSPPERLALWKAHPEHAWYGYLREDWIEAVNGEPTLTRLN